MPTFKLLKGKHVNKGKVYRAGETITTDQDLSKHNAPGAMKFERLGDADPAPKAASPAPAPAVNVDRMSLTELQAYADDEEIDLKGAKTREEVLKQIKTAQAPQSTAAPVAQVKK